MARVWAIKFAYGMCEHCKRFDADYSFHYPSADDRRSVIGLLLEVNHMTPLNGAPRAKTCANHQMNLETLCHACHVTVTTQQLAERKQRDADANRPCAPALNPT